jgi:hypothetical protein
MTLPTFLGIGAPRAGTTWLHTLLASHPDAYLPTRRKEIRFFDRHYDRGLDWYETFFCPPDDAHRYSAIGEISPQYLYCQECPDRIVTALPGVKLLVMLRHPVDRAYSKFGFDVQRGHAEGSFEAFLDARPLQLERGFYSRYLEHYLRHFDRRDILPLVFEETIGRAGRAHQVIAAHLGLRPDRFPRTPGRVNPSTVPRFGSLSSLAVKVARQLQRTGLERVVDLGDRLGLRSLLTSGKAFPPLDPDVRKRLGHLYEAEFDRLERCLDIDLRCWRT